MHPPRSGRRDWESAKSRTLCTPRKNPPELIHSGVAWPNLVIEAHAHFRSDVHSPSPEGGDAIDREGRNVFDEMVIFIEEKLTVIQEGAFWFEDLHPGIVKEFFVSVPL